VLHDTLQTIAREAIWYSNPCNKSLLPFPMLYSRLPVDRFDLKQENEGDSKRFEYMGRERFKTLWEVVEKFQISWGFSQSCLQGSMGCGKSHILAALTCLLSHIGRRPVYIPDCRQMLVDPLPYIQCALLCAFADASSSMYRDKIRRFQTLDDALEFCRNLRSTHLYFIIDQMNALEHEDRNTVMVSNDQKDILAEFLQKISLGHYSITGASANYRTVQRMAQKQTGEVWMSMMGGMSGVSLDIISFSPF
jgi:hypothetical protein